MGLALPAFLAMWVPMMAAMMFPALAPVATLWGRSISRTVTGARRIVRQGSFVAGYIVAWAVYGLVAFGVLLGTERLAEHTPDAARWIGASAFLAAGLYQLTPLKRVCLRHCRSPLGQFLRYGSLRGRMVDLRVGMLHGAYCVGCCWALMLVLVAVGVMNLPAMVGLAAVIFLEKVWRYGTAVAWAVSAGFVVLAVLALFFPVLLPGLSTTGPGM
jgi:predicted metal-binding membrane protein